MNTKAEEAIQAVLRCQQDFWQALKQSDTALFTQVLAKDFICRSPAQPEQERTTFITVLTSLPLTVLAVTAERLAVRLLDDVAVLTGVQIAHMQLRDGSVIAERLALTNIFQRIDGQWQMILAHPVTLSA